MPYAPDKIIINRGSARGMDAAVQAELDNAAHLGAEIVEKGWAAETVGLRDALTKACQEHHDAEVKYHQFLRDYVAKLASFIDNHP